MFNHTHYVPILKGKMNEYAALSELPDDVRASLTPVFDVPFLSAYTEDSLQDHLDKQVRFLCQYCAGSGPVFVDLRMMDTGHRLPDGTHALTYVFDAVRAQADPDVPVEIIPVTGPQRDTSYQQAVAGVVAADQRGAAMRFQDADLLAGTQHNLQSLLNRLGMRRSDVDIIIDFEHIRQDEVQTRVNAAQGIIKGFPSVATWRTLTIGATGFPADLGSIRPESEKRFARAEWHMYDALIANRGDLPRMPTFGDYGISHPELEDLDTSQITIAVKLRYTVGDEFLVLKKRSTRSAGGYRQFHDLAQDLVQRAEYSGRGFSWGDRMLDQCANRDCGPGNAGTWIKIGVSHHVTTVVDQISNHPGI